MVKMKMKLLPILFLCLVLTYPSVFAQQKDKVRIYENNGLISIENEYVKFDFNLAKGTYRAINQKDGMICLSDAYFQVGQITSDNPQLRWSWKKEEVNDALGLGKKLIIKASSPYKINIILAISIYSDQSFLVLGLGLENLTEKPIQCKNLSPLIGKAFPGLQVRNDLYTLDGNGGGEKTAINSDVLRNCRNNILATFNKGEQRKSLVLGGLTYHDFEKFITLQSEVNGMQVSLYAFDPVGKRVDAGSMYMPDDLFYIDFHTSNPFEALEKYALSLKSAQQIHLNVYDFPTVCLWYVGSKDYGNGPANNNSKGAVWEADQIAKSGFLKYSRAGVRLVPDNYEANNAQGWWDDAHFQTSANTSSDEKNCYVKPYETTEKWAKAVSGLGVLPFIYSQTARRSEDYSLKHPDQMLFNQSYYHSTYRTLSNEAWWHGTTQPLLWSYDFTDSCFIKHLREVYSNFNKAGIKGLMFDYPSTGWDYEGGFDNVYSTTASAYRDIFRFAFEGLGSGSYINERNLERGSDITLGVVGSQRTWGDTDLDNPLIVTRGGLRWYKNRVVVNYDMDAKNLNHCVPDNRDGQRCMLTMSYVTTGRLVLANSFSQLTSDQFFDLTRTFPYHSNLQSARPIDAFAGKKFPEIYDFVINKSWHQLTLYNAALDNYDCEYPWYGGSDCTLKGKPIASSIEVCLDLPQADGGLGLDTSKRYYLYDFWNHEFIGMISGKGILKQNLRAGEARMISLHEVENHPQFISTNRHIMQGYIDVLSYGWDEKNKKLYGKSAVVGGETYEIIIATNNFQPIKSKVNKGKCKITHLNNGLIELSIDVPENNTVEWAVDFR
jgi:hypothetical protein